MIKKKYTVALVNYLNAKPYYHGLLAYKDGPFTFDVLLMNPAECAQAYKEGRADIALVPSGSLHDMQTYRKMNRFGIAADNEVRTVCLFSQNQPQDWKEIFLDNHSMTSILLTRLILKHVFQLQPEYKTSDVARWTAKTGQAALMIGDKVFERENDFEIRIDLATEWKKWTGLPFVFAVWITNPEVPGEVVNALEEAFEHGLHHMDDVIKENHGSEALLQEYFRRYIRYKLDDNYLEGLETYLRLSREEWLASKSVLTTTERD